MCNKKIRYTFTRICSTYVPYSSKTYTDIIFEIVKDESSIVITALDNICDHCTKVFNVMSRLEWKLVRIKSEILYNVQKSQGLLTPDQDDKVRML